MSLPFAGRWQELNQLVQAFDRAERGQPHMLFVDGEAGIGTTALLDAFRAVVVRKHPKLKVLQTGASESARYDPVADAATLLAHGTLEHRLHADRMDSDTRELVVAWVEALVPLIKWGTAIVRTVGRVRRRHYAELPKDPQTRALLIAATRPLLLLMDDLHTVDAGATAHLETLVRSGSGPFHLLLVGAMQSPAPGEPPRPIDRMLRTLPADAVTRIRLRGLPEGELRELLRERFAGFDVPASLLAEALKLSGGHPGVLARLLERSAESGRLDPAAGRWDLAVPGGAHDDVDDGVADLAALRPATIEILGAASVAGTEFDGTTLARALSRDELEVEDHLAAATRVGIVGIVGERVLDDGELTTVYRFESLPLRAALHRRLPDALRRDLEAKLSVPHSTPS